MSEDHFNYLLERISNRIQKSDTHLREAIPAQTKLEITLRYLATGDSFKSLEFLFKVPKSTISKFLPDVLDNIYTCLQEWIEVPNAIEKWQQIVNEFCTKWNFPNCIGAIDGKHIVIKAPQNSGSDYFNYKKDNSIILLALVDHDYCFTYIDVGAKGRASDGGVWQHCSLRHAIETRDLNIPLNGIIVGDDAIPLKTFLLKPYSKRQLTREEKIFHYRLSRARRISENAFGILVSKFRVFEKPILLSPEKVDKVVLACCALHNWLRKTGTTYVPFGLIDYEDMNHISQPGSWRYCTSDGLVNIQLLTGDRNPTRVASQKRDNYCKYFNGEGAVPWQWRIID
ncbi:putative nuclease HARBI1 [Anoplophora glabripennis]|uniref:putative nuclease HARBI1 n=1 Tax=Anoplophora glabripennis TaxID=217634 RepID=UPI000C7564FA|nr:putative nuclease HARBI1 [Anoplophora glabripennis]